MKYWRPKLRVALTCNEKENLLVKKKTYVSYINTSVVIYQVDTIESFFKAFTANMTIN